MAGDLACSRLDFGRPVDQHILAHALAAIGGRGGRHGLGGRIPFAGHVALGHLHFGYRPHRLAVGAVQHIEKALLGGLGDRLHNLSIVRDVANDAGGGDVAVPHAMMDHLVVPFAHAGLDVQRHQAVAEQVVAVPVDAHHVGVGQLYPAIDQAQFLVGRHRRPAAGIARRFRLARNQPGVVAEFTFPRNGVEYPLALAGLDVEAADIALGGGRGRGADHNGVLHHQRRCMQADDAAVGIHLLVVILAQVDHAVLAEGRIGQARLRIEGEHRVADGDVEDALVGAVGPIGAAQARTLAAAIALTFVMAVHPQKLAGGAVQAYHVAAMAGCGVDLSVHEQRRGLVVGIQVRAQRVGGEAPHHLQLVEARRVDLIQRRVAGAGKIIGIVEPLAVLRVALRLGHGALRSKKRKGRGTGHHRPAVDREHCRHFLLNVSQIVSAIGGIYCDLSTRQKRV